MHQADYAAEKLTEAVETLATGTGSLQERLDHASMPHLMSIRPKHHLPWPDLEDQFLQVDLKLRDGAAKLSNDDAREVAKAICSLCFRVRMRIRE